MADDEPMTPDDYEILNLKRQLIDAESWASVETRRANTLESQVRVLEEALRDIVAEADQSNGGKGARLPIVLHIREIAIAALAPPAGTPQEKP